MDMYSMWWFVKKGLHVKKGSSYIIIFLQTEYLKGSTCQKFHFTRKDEKPCHINKVDYEVLCLFRRILGMKFGLFVRIWVFLRNLVVWNRFILKFWHTHGLSSQKKRKKRKEEALFKSKWIKSWNLECWFLISIIWNFEFEILPYKKSLNSSKQSGQWKSTYNHMYFLTIKYNHLHF